MPPRLPKLIQAQEDAVAQVNQNVNAPSPVKPSTNTWNTIIEDDGRGNVRPRTKKDIVDNKLKNSIDEWMAANVPSQVTPAYTQQEEYNEPDYLEPEAPRPEAPSPVVEPVTENVDNIVTPTETEQKPETEPVVRTTVQPNKANEPMPNIPQTPEETFDEWTQYLDLQNEAEAEEESFVENNPNVPETNYVQPVTITAGNMVIPPSRVNPITVQTPDQLEWERENYIGDRANLTPQEWQWFNGDGSVKTGVGGTPVQPNSRPLYTPEEVQAIQYLQEIDVPVTDDSIAQVLADFTPEELGAPVNEWNSSSGLDTIMGLGASPAEGAVNSYDQLTAAEIQNALANTPIGQQNFDQLFPGLIDSTLPESVTPINNTPVSNTPDRNTPLAQIIGLEYVENTATPAEQRAEEQMLYNTPETPPQNTPETNNNIPMEEVITPYQPTLDVETQQDIYDWFMNGQNDYLDQIEEERQLQEDLYNTQYYGENWREILDQEEADRQAEYRDYDIQELRSQALDNVRDNQEYTDAYNDLINQHLEELGESVEDLTPEELDSITQQTEAELEEQGITPTTFEDEYQKLLNDEIDPIAERLLQSETNQRVEARRNADEKAQRGAIANQLVDMGYTPDQAAYLVQHMNDDGTVPKDVYLYVVNNPNGLYTSDREIIWEPPSGTADNPNYTLEAILRGDFWIEPMIDGQPIPEGTELYEVARRGNAERVLRFYDQGEGGGFKDLNIPDEIKNFIADSQWDALGQLDNVRINEDGTIEHYENPNAVQYIDATAEEYQAAIEALIKANPALMEMLDNDIITIDDVMNHFFKGLRVKGAGSGTGSGSGYGYGGYGYRGYGGGRGYGGYGGYSSPYRPNDTARNQEEQRINNIMKNWTF